MTASIVPRKAVSSIWHAAIPYRPRHSHLQLMPKLPMWVQRCSISRCASPQNSLSQSCGGSTPHCRLQSQMRSQTRSQTLSCRQFATTSKTNSWWHWLGQRDGRKAKKLPPLASFLDGSAPRLISKAKNEPRLRCTEFDEHGNVTLVNGEFKKSELIQMYGLLPRDLRKIDSSLLPSILVRPTAILLNLLHLRVLIKHNRVLVFDAYGSSDSYTQSVFMYDLEGKLRHVDARSNGTLPYELRALEAVLISVTNALESEFEGIREPVATVLRELEEDIDREKLRYLLIYSKKLGTFEQTARLVRDALEELLEADDDLADMYLTDKAKQQVREDDDHQDVELLLESYHKVTNEIVQAAENLVSNIRNTEEIVKAILDANRNALMLLELRFSVWTLGLGAGTFIAALYGMNLKNFIEESDAGFWGVSAVCSVASFVVLGYGLRRLRQVQRVSMWGNDCGPMPPVRWNRQHGQWNFSSSSNGGSGGYDGGYVAASAENGLGGISGAVAKAHASRVQQMHKARHRHQGQYDSKWNNFGAQGPLWSKLSNQQKQAVQHAKHQAYQQAGSKDHAAASSTTIPSTRPVVTE